MHLSPELVDTVADYLAIFVIIFVPGLLIALFWMVHILPEKVAYKRGHPQADAIKTLCLLSLVFGGLLWPLAWLWAYSKPVMYKLAYGTDRVEHPGHETELNGVAVSGDLPLGPATQPRNGTDLAAINSLPGEH
jgi:CBS domain containing-hemolysin-like protein